MFHAAGILVQVKQEATGMFAAGKIKGPDLRPAPEVTRFTRLHLRRSEGQCGQLGGRCSHRTASKTSMPTLNEQRNRLHYDCKMNYGCNLFKTFFAYEEHLVILSRIADKKERFPLLRVNSEGFV